MSKKEFPSPCGEWVRKVIAPPGYKLVGIDLQAFPSPCGEWVRKGAFLTLLEAS